MLMNLAQQRMACKNLRERYRGTPLYDFAKRLVNIIFLKDGFTAL